MATPRKRWFKVADSILREDWSDSVLATQMRLMAWLNQRWRRDGIPHEGAGRAVIGAMDAMLITHTQAARAALRKLARHPREAGLTSARAHLDDGARPTRVILEWDKFPEFQEMGARLRGSDGAVTAPSDSDSGSESVSGSDEEKSPPPAAASADAAADRAVRSDQPSVPGDLFPPAQPPGDAQQPEQEKSPAKPASPAAVRLTGAFIAMVADCYLSAKIPGTPRARAKWELAMDGVLREYPAADIELAIEWLAVVNKHREQFRFRVEAPSSLKQKIGGVLDEARRWKRPPSVTATRPSGNGVRRGGLTDHDREINRQLREDPRFARP